MKKIMLVYEDIQESARVMVTLKKVGFDVEATKTVAGLADQLLVFNPDAVIGCGFNTASTLAVGQKLKELKGAFKGKSLLILPAGNRPSAAELAKVRVDTLMESPVTASAMIDALARALSLDAAPLKEKFQKAQIQEHAAPPTPRLSKETFTTEKAVFTVKGNKTTLPNLTIEDKKRAEGYQKFIEGMQIDTHQTSHTKAAVKARQAELKKDWDKPFLEKLDDLRRQFAQALFKKND